MPSNIFCFDEHSARVHCSYFLGSDKIQIYFLQQFLDTLKFEESEMHRRLLSKRWCPAEVTTLSNVAQDHRGPIWYVLSFVVLLLLAIKRNITEDHHKERENKVSMIWGNKFQSKMIFTQHKKKLLLLFLYLIVMTILTFPILI